MLTLYMILYGIVDLRSVRVWSHRGGGGCHSSYIIFVFIIYVCTRAINVKSELTQSQCAKKRKAFIYKYHRLFINL